MTILVEIVGSGIIGDGEIQPAIVVDINKDGGQAVETLGIGNAGFLTDVRKSTVTIVMEKMIAFTDQSARAAHHVHASKLAEAG